MERSTYLVSYVLLCGTYLVYFYMEESIFIILLLNISYVIFVFDKFVLGQINIKSSHAKKKNKYYKYKFYKYIQDSFIFTHENIKIIFNILILYKLFVENKIKQKKIKLNSILLISFK